MKKRQFLLYGIVGLLAVFTGCGDDDLSFKDTKDGASFQTDWIPTISLDSTEEIKELSPVDQLVYIRPSGLRLEGLGEGKYYLYLSSDNMLYKIRNTKLEGLDMECDCTVKLEGTVCVLTWVPADNTQFNNFIQLEVESVTIK